VSAKSRQHDRPPTNLPPGARPFVIDYSSQFFQLTAFFTSAAILASSAAVSSISAQEFGHMAPVVQVRLVAEAQRCVPALELGPLLEEADHVAVFGVRGRPVQVLGTSPRCRLDDRWTRSAMERSGSAISAIFAQHLAFPVCPLARPP